MTIALYPATALTDDLSTLTADVLNTWRTNLPKAIDGTAGGTYAPSAKVQIGGSGLELTVTSGAASRIQLASRSIVRHFSMGGTYDSANGVGTFSRNTAAPYHWKQDTIGAVLVIPLDELPNGNVLDSVTIRLDPAAGHGTDPPNIVWPTLCVYRIDGTGTATGLAAAATDSGTRAAYEAAHDLTQSGLAHTIDRTLYRYHALLTGEGGVEFQAAMAVYQIKASVSCTSLSEW